MKTKDGALRHFGIAFGLALLLYLVAYHWIESCRVSKSPWQVTFLQTTNEPPCIIIHQPNLNVESALIVFEGVEPAADHFQETITFNTARPVPFEVPFGKCVFLDTTFLPGTVTLQCFGHEIEMIPRVLIIDHKEHQWETATRISLKGNRTE
jgi:hypothetical protein